MIDVCIVGAGAMGLYVSSRLARSGLSVTLVESDEDSRSGMRDSVRPTGTHRGATQGWTTGLGGTTQLWGGQMWPWEDHEFAGDAVLGINAWPEDVAEGVAQSYGLVLEHLGLGRGHAEIHAGSLVRRQANSGLIRGRVRHSSWMNRRERHFAVNAQLSLARAKTNLARMRVRQVERIRQDEWAVLGTVGVDPKLRTIPARRVLLAAGTLGNFTILARSSFGPDLEGLGSGLMDHVSSAVAEFKIVNAGRFRALAAPSFHRGVLGSPRLLPEPQQSAIKLPGYAHWQIAPPSWLPLGEVKSFLATRNPGDAVASGRALRGHSLELGVTTVAGVVRRQRPVLPTSDVTLHVDVQQPAYADNRLVFDAERDTTAVHWTTRELERESIRAIAGDVLAQLDLSSLGLELTGLPALEPHDIFHMMGTAPLALEGGVVNGDLEVAGQRRLHVLGAGAFPSGGMANPTMTALALSERVISRVLEEPHG